MYKGTPKLSLTILEEVKAVQYDKPTITDTWDVSGCIECKVKYYNKRLFTINSAMHIGRT